MTIHDHTQVKHLLEQLEELATRDGLTDVYNRYLFRSADLAVYEAKEAGRNRVCISSAVSS